MLCRYNNGKQDSNVMPLGPMKICTRILHSWNRNSKSCRADYFGQMFLLHTFLHCTIMNWCRLLNGAKIQILSKYDFLHIQKKYFEIHSLELLKFMLVSFFSKSWQAIIIFLLRKLLNDKIQFIKEPFGSAL